MVKITIKTDNAAFQDPDGKPDKYYLQLEVMRVLKKLIEDIEDHNEFGAFLHAAPIMDYNGNRVGDYEVIDDE